MTYNCMPPRIILVDLDGPLADFEGEFLKRWWEQFPNEFFVPLEKRRAFFLKDEYPEHLREEVVRILTTTGFFADLSPVPGGIDAVKEMTDRGYKIIICTSDIYIKNINTIGLDEKRGWVQKYLGYDFAKTMVLTRDKTLVRGDYLIDDKPEITG